MNNIQVPCKIYKLNVNKNTKAIQCDLCKYWVHIECNHLDCIDNKYFQGWNYPWFCATCCSVIFPFASLNNNCCLSAFSCERFNKSNEKRIETKDSSLLLNSSITNLALLLKQFNNNRPEVNDDPDNVANSKYYSINEIQSLKVTNKNESFSMFHTNVCSLNKNFDDLEYLLKCANKKFDVVAVS